MLSHVIASTLQEAEMHSILTPFDSETERNGEMRRKYRQLRRLSVFVFVFVFVFVWTSFGQRRRRAR